MTLTLSNNTHIQKHSHQNLVPKYCNITLQSYSVQDSRTISCEVQLYSLQEMISLQELKCHSTSLFLLRALTNIQLTFFLYVVPWTCVEQTPTFFALCHYFFNVFLPRTLISCKETCKPFLDFLFFGWGPFFPSQTFFLFLLD